MKIKIGLIFLFISTVAYSQNDKALIGRRILNSDSVIIINNLELKSDELIDSLLENKSLKHDIFKSRAKLTARAKKELATIFINPTNYRGRFASCSGFNTERVFFIWKSASFSFVKVSLHTHDLLSCTNGIKKLIFIDPRVVDKLEDLFEKLDTYPVGVLRQ